MADSSAGRRCHNDGLNLYHALCDLKRDHLKWLDPGALGKRLINRRQERLVPVVRRSAYPGHLRDAAKTIRHRTYVAALQARGANRYLGHFKTRSTSRRYSCGHE